jgi:hypothetical protein
LTCASERHDRTENDRRYTVYVIGTWLVPVVSAAFAE